MFCVQLASLDVGNGTAGGELVSEHNQGEDGVTKKKKKKKKKKKPVESDACEEPSLNISVAQQNGEGNPGLSSVTVCIKPLLCT